MSDRYQNRYRIASARHPNWNYSWAGAYFITICTQGRLNWFGEISENTFQPNPIGDLATSEWIKSPTLRPDMNLSLGAYVVMPNHFHGILIIGHNIHNAPDKHISNQFGPQRKNVASVIRSFKGQVTRQARLHRPSFGWQARYHDHIIRNEKAYQRITQYIESNPLNWEADCFHPSAAPNKFTL